MERNNGSSSKYFTCKKMRQALSTFPSFRGINNRLSQHRQHSKTVAIDSNSPPSSPVRTIHIQTKPTTSSKLHQPPRLLNPEESSEAIPIKFDYSNPATVEKKDMNKLFEDFIQRTKDNFKTVSNAGRGQGEAVADDKDNKDHGVKKKDNHREHFSNFIHVARNKLRTTSGIRRE